MAQTVTLTTAEELLKLPSDFRCELIDGVVIETSPLGMAGGVAAAHFIGALGAYERSRRQGYALGSCGYVVRRAPDTVREATLSYVCHNHPGKLDEGYPSESPCLVVHVLSPYETPAETQGRIRDWVEFGVLLVWVVYPETRTVQVIHSLQERRALDTDDILDGGDVLPGFSCPVAELFD